MNKLFLDDAIKEILSRVGLFDFISTPESLDLICLIEDGKYNEAIEKTGSFFNLKINSDTSFVDPSKLLPKAIAQIVVPDNLDIKDLINGKRITAKIFITNDSYTNIRKHPKAFIAVIAHELSHLLLKYLYTGISTNGFEEVYVDMASMMVGFGEIIKAGRAYYRQLGDQNYTHTIGYLNNEDFEYVYNSIKSMVEWKKATINDYPKRISKYKQLITELDYRVSNFKDLLARVDEEKPDVEKDDAPYFVQYHQLDFLHPYKNTIDDARKQEQYLLLDNSIEIKNIEGKYMEVSRILDKMEIISKELTSKYENLLIHTERINWYLNKAKGIRFGKYERPKPVIEINNTKDQKNRENKRVAKGIIKRVVSWILAILTIIVVVIVLLWFISITGKPNRNDDMYMGTKVSSGSIFYANHVYLDGLGELTIKNGTAYDAVVKLVSNINNKSVVTIYIGANQNYTIRKISNGTYYLYFNTGRGWDTIKERFIDSNEYSKFAEAFDFATTETETDDSIDTEYSTFEVTLNPVVGGKAITYQVTEGDFNNY